MLSCAATSCGGAGDRIDIFGLSRGAFSARSLAGFVPCVGTLLASRPDLVDAAYAVYESGHEPRDTLRVDFLQRAADVPMLQHADDPAAMSLNLSGLWDTVAAPGLPGRAADVGGGDALAESGMSQAALRWMADEARGFALQLDDRVCMVSLLGGSLIPGGQSPGAAILRADVFSARCTTTQRTGTALTDDLLQLLHAVLLIVGALLPVVNPPGNVPIFLNLTEGCDEATRRDLARHIAIYSFALLLGSMLLGTLVLRLFDLSVAALQVAGGAVVCALGWNLLHYQPRAQDSQPDPEQARQVALGRAFYPLTLPVSVDAGVVAVAITLGAHHGQTLAGRVIQFIAAVLGSAAIAASLLLVYRYATRVSGWIGNKGMEVMLRLSALLVLSIGVQIVWNGLKSLLAEIHIA